MANVFQLFQNTSSHRSFCYRLIPRKKGLSLFPVDDNNGVYNWEELSPMEGDALFRRIYSLYEQSIFNIDWENTSNEFYLNGHDDLILQLLKSGKLLDKKGLKVPYIHNSSLLCCRIDLKDENTYQSKLKLGDIGSVKFVGKTVVWKSGTFIFHTQEIENYTVLNEFETLFPVSDLELFLSILMTHLPNVQVQVANKNITAGEPLLQIDTLYFEKIDSEKQHYLRTERGIREIEDPRFFTYHLTTVAKQKNDIIRIHPLISEPLNDAPMFIETHLKKIEKSLKISGGYFRDGTLFIIEEQSAKAFLIKCLPALLSRFSVFGADKLKEYNYKLSKPKLNADLSFGIDFLEGNATVHMGEDEIGLFDFINSYKTKSYIQLSDGSGVLVDPAYVKKLERLFNKTKDGVKISFFDLPLVEELLDEQLFSETFKQSKEIFLGFNTINEKKIQTPKLNATLRDYQTYGLKWLKYLHETGLGGCLADDMGLGKTIQTISLLQTIYPKEKKPTLIVMPRTLMFNWQDEVEKFAPTLKTYHHYGAKRTVEDIAKSQLVFTTYGTLRSDVEKLKDISFYYLILDESQHIKNVNAKVNKAVLLLNSEHRLALSGTPLENNLSELYALFRFLNPAMFGGFESFNQNYLIPVQKNNDSSVAIELRKKIYPFILRRLKKDVLSDLPEKIEKHLFVEMKADQLQFYEEKRRFYLNEINQTIERDGVQKSQFIMLQALTELRQIASNPESKTEGKIRSPKLDVLISEVETLALSSHKVLIFANFINALETIAEELNEKKIQYVVMTGATQNREELIHQFISDAETTAFLMTLKTGGVGLNLTVADHVFIYDPWWNASAESQAIDRTHRIGQDKTVFSYKLICKGSIEEKILQLQEKKKELFNQLIGSDSASVKSLSEDDIRFIMEG